MNYYGNKLINYLAFHFQYMYTSAFPMKLKLYSYDMYEVYYKSKYIKDICLFQCKIEIYFTEGTLDAKAKPRVKI